MTQDSEQDGQPQPRLSLADAQRMLPLVRRIAGDIVRLSSDLAERRQRFDHLTTGRDLESRDPYSSELADVRRRLDEDRRRLDGYVSELTSLGLQLGDPNSGAVDFPSELDGRPICFCWRVGEQDIRFWHEPDACQLERYPLETASRL